jgi:hypothetical protein
LLEERTTSWSWIQTDVLTILAYLAGSWDAEGHVGIFKNANCTAIILNIYNTNTDFLGFIKASFIRIGFHPVGPYLDKRKGTTTSKYKIARKKDYFRLALANFDESQLLLRRMSVRHPEKIARKELALSLHRGDRWEAVREKVKSLRRLEIQGRDEFVKLAETTYRLTHPEEEPGIESADRNRR